MYWEPNVDRIEPNGDSDGDEKQKWTEAIING